MELQDQAGNKYDVQLVPGAFEPHRGLRQLMAERGIDKLPKPSGDPPVPQEGETVGAFVARVQLEGWAASVSRKRSA